jgi:hypothetical protein
MTSLIPSMMGYQYLQGTQVSPNISIPGIGNATATAFSPSPNWLAAAGFTPAQIAAMS